MNCIHSTDWYSAFTTEIPGERCLLVPQYACLDGGGAVMCWGPWVINQHSSKEKSVSMLYFDLRFCQRFTWNACTHTHIHIQKLSFWCWWCYLHLGDSYRKRNEEVSIPKYRKNLIISLTPGLLKWVPAGIWYDWTSWKLLINFLGVFSKTSRFANPLRTLQWSNS